MYSWLLNPLPPFLFFHVLSPPCSQKWLYIISRLLNFLYSIVVLLAAQYYCAPYLSTTLSCMDLDHVRHHMSRSEMPCVQMDGSEFDPRDAMWEPRDTLG